VVAKIWHWLVLFLDTGTCLWSVGVVIAWNSRNGWLHFRKIPSLSAETANALSVITTVKTWNFDWWDPILTLAKLCVFRPLSHKRTGHETIATVAVHTKALWRKAWRGYKSNQSLVCTDHETSLNLHLCCSWGHWSIIRCQHIKPPAISSQEICCKHVSPQE
jgi:hypothetical protein